MLEDIAAAFRNNNKAYIDNYKVSKYNKLMDRGILTQVFLRTIIDCQKVVSWMNMEKMIKGNNWDGTEISVQLKHLPEWTKWDIYNRKNQIHPTQKVFTEAEFLPKMLHLSNLQQSKHN